MRVLGSQNEWMDLPEVLKLSKLGSQPPPSHLLEHPTKLLWDINTGPGSRGVLR